MKEIDLLLGLLRRRIVALGLGLFAITLLIKHLDLSGNDFGGIQVPRFIGSLGNLEYLNLSGSGFGGVIPDQLGNLTKLHILCLGSLHASELTSMRNMQWLSNLPFLQHLDMSGVNLNKAVDWFQVINTLPSLVQLHLSNCQLPHIYPHVPSLNLTSLSLLDLSNNDFTNTSMPRWIFSITGLVSLDLGWCYFHGLIPNSIDSFRNLTSLKMLCIRGNDFRNSSLVLEGLSSVGSNLITLDMHSCRVPSSVLDSLHNLTSLLSLDLSENQLTETIPKSLSNICNLRHIDMGGNYFPNISLTSLLENIFECKSPSLESLFLENSQLSCHLPDQLGQLMYLVDLQLRNNRIAGIIPDSIGRLSFLRSLGLDGNLISGPIPYSVRRLSSLEYLNLSDNQLNGSLPDSLGQLSKLNTLDLSYNQLSGSLPDSLGQLSKLNSLGLSNNQLNGSLLDSLGQLSKLNFLDFSSNLLTGVVTEVHFAKLARLETLVGSGNNITVRSHIANWIPSFRLLTLSLSSWNLGPQFPVWLTLQRDLISLDLSNTKISSTIPESFWKSLPNLRYLDMSQNHIQGMLLGIPRPLLLLDLSFNEFGGQLPTLLDGSEISFMDLSNNSFAGSLRHILCPNSQKSVRVLNLADNNLSGVIPECWMRWPGLSFLSLENNNLIGRIPRTLGSLSRLQSLNLCNNKLSGILPVSLKNLISLQILQLARNELVGRIPSWFGKQFSSLRILNLRANHFDGHINDGLCYLNSVQILDVADNNLSGNIPRCFNYFSVLSGKQTPLTTEFAYARAYGTTHGSASLVIKGREDTYSSILGLVMLLDLSGNNFSGSIPSELMSLQALQSLNLSKNQLTGRIPKTIGDLKSLVAFDASLNRLSGELPVSLSSLSFLSSFNVSYNNLTGRIPSSTQFQTFNESSFLGNKLCGDQVTESCAVEVPDHRDEEEEGDDDGSHGADWGLIISIVSGFIAGFWVVFAPLIVSTTWRVTYFRFLRDWRFMFSDAIRSRNMNKTVPTFK
ncbi:receptor-like protein EIX2 [Cynara cardunculus var. scolymus]|uniref:receptor-like protein EIX2 n=1 Tax=Cynara cardunculus var. scolymus TaxID=59895 RepID=UPI000D62FB82|nr:receptor-like protein EIX2 [Cynara cardunculus var. scolymus]